MSKFGKLGVDGVVGLIMCGKLTHLIMVANT